MRNYSITFSPCLFFSCNEINHSGKCYTHRYFFSFTSRFMVTTMISYYFPFFNLYLKNKKRGISSFFLHFCFKDFFIYLNNIFYITYFLIINTPPPSAITTSAAIPIYNFASPSATVSITGASSISSSSSLKLSGTESISGVLLSL